MKHVLATVDKVAATDVTILIKKENGTGKEHVARLMHFLCKRGNRPPQSINCSAIPENLLESESLALLCRAFIFLKMKNVVSF